MITAGAWIRNQSNLITFVLVDNTNTEVPGIGNAFTLEISKNGGAFQASAGVKAEISDGWYSYQATAAESDTIGTISIKITHASIVQQNLEYVVMQRNAGCTEHTYTVTNSVTLAPIPDVKVWATTDINGQYVVWYGTTDAFGVARDQFGNKPCLDAGTYYFWKRKIGLTDDQNPDIEIVS